MAAYFPGDFADTYQCLQLVQEGRDGDREAAASLRLNAVYFGLYFALSDGNIRCSCRDTNLRSCQGDVRVDILNELLYKITVEWSLVKQQGENMLQRLTILLLVTFLAIPSVVFAAKTHKVKKSETLVSIAKKYHVSIPSLKEANNRLNSSIKPGDILVIPPRTASASAGKEVTVSASTYKVRKGDTILKIARKTGVSVARLKSLNGIGKGKLRTGQILALCEDDAERSDSSRVARAEAKPTLRYADLLNEKEYEQSLSELLEQDGVNLGVAREADEQADNVKLLKTKAFGFLGTRYRFGGSSRSGLDCSAFVQKVFNEMDVNLPRTAREQYERGEVVAQGDMQKGDLVFFRTYASFPSHVGIYLGNNRMIHASSRDRRVVISSVDTPYYRSRFIGAKRVAKINPDSLNLDELMLGVEEEVAEEALKNDTLGLAKTSQP